MTNVARFTVNNDPSANAGYDCVNGTALAFRIEGTPSVVVQRVNFAVYDATAPSSPLASKDAPTITLDNGAGSTGQDVQAATPGAEVTTTAPVAGVHSYIVRCTVNGGIDFNGRANTDYVFERLLAIRSAAGLRKEVFTETSQYAPRGPADAQNELVDAYGAPPASGILTDTTNFDNNLSSADTTVQKALDTLDNLVIGSGAPTDWVALTPTTDYATTPASATTLTMASNKIATIQPGDPIRWMSSVGLLSNNTLES